MTADSPAEPLGPPADVPAFVRDWDRFDAFADALGTWLEELLSDAGVDFRDIVHRAKSPRSLRGKLALRDDDGTPLYPTSSEVHDLVGIRIICNLTRDITRVADVLADNFTVSEVRDKSREVREAGRIGYAGLHFIGRMRDDLGDDLPAELAGGAGLTVEIQIRTILQDAWAQFEHGVRYKPRSGVVTAEMDRSLTLASGLLELADEQFAHIQELQIEQSRATAATLRDPATEDVRALDADDVRDGLLRLLPGKNLSRKSHYEWALQLLVAAGVTTDEELDAWLAGRDVDALREKMRYRYEPGHVRLLDDLLLQAFGTDYIRATEGLGNDPARPAKLRRRRQLLTD